MGTLALTSLLIGAGIGLRFRVFALFPVMFLGLPAIAIWGFGHGQALWSIMLLIFVGTACLQVGYLAGTLPRFLFIAARVIKAENPQRVRPFAQ